jgi:WD40 repeat protein
MSSRQAARVGAWVNGCSVACVPGSAGQEHVRLMPQLGSVEITFVAFSPDGHFVLTGGWGDAARLWDAASGL